MDLFYEIVGLLLLLLGVVGSFLPVLPGPLSGWFGLLVANQSSRVDFDTSFMIITFCIALGVFLLYYSLSMLGEQLVKVGTLVPWFGMWLSTLTLLPLAIALMWSTTHERRWLPQWGSK